MREGVGDRRNRRLDIYTTAHIGAILLNDRTADERHRLEVETTSRIFGAVILDKHILNDLWALVREDTVFSAFVNAHVRLSFYADFLFPMGT